MLFNSYAFLLGFFPVTLLVFLIIARASHAWAGAWLVAASLFFYGYWSIAALPLLILSACMNFWFGHRVTPFPGVEPRVRKARLILAVALNLSILGYFKYANFFIDNLNYALHALSRSEVRALNVALPIGISFFTFTQIAFLVDCYQGKVRERNFLHYLLFVSYFPHLISGPVLHHSQMMPQFRHADTYRLRSDHVLAGLFNIATGLAKKVLLADEFSQYATPVFNAARDGHSLTYLAAWTGVFAYTLQIYFDFSGYSDMAIGLSRMLGIKLPLNFDAPYKSASIIEFWRRWHITLSNFLRDYLYVPLGGNRRGGARRYGNLLLTMLLGGLWHGANWTFVAWGGLHGTYLLINHGWRTVAPPMPDRANPWWVLGKIGGSAMTFLAVAIAWVFFRATTFAGAANMLSAMTHFQPIRCSADCFAEVYGDIAIPWTSPGYLCAFFASGFALVWLFPTSQAMTERLLKVRLESAWICSGALLACIALLAIINTSHHTSEFIYFNF